MALNSQGQYSRLATQGMDAGNVVGLPGVPGLNVATWRNPTGAAAAVDVVFQHNLNTPAAAVPGGNGASPLPFAIEVFFQERFHYAAGGINPAGIPWEISAQTANTVTIRVPVPAADEVSGSLVIRQRHSIVA